MKEANDFSLLFALIFFCYKKNINVSCFCLYRILEFECCADSSSKSLKYEVELWDCSGDRKFEKCWPAMRKDASGVMLVFDPNILNDVQELEAWHHAFVRYSGLLEPQCLLVAHQKPGSHGDIKKHDLPLADTLKQLKYSWPNHLVERQAWPGSS
uniref:Intraflagellar transport protein 22 homolog n=1 Tax=Eptatretus burgeri TaxID=7764 RepID=A0A8C4NJL7_EPTBU